MKLVAIYFPAVFLDAPQPGEYVRDSSGMVRIVCVECGVVQRPKRLDLIHACANPACDAPAVWIELAKVG